MKRAARSMRRGSSVNDSSGASGVRRRPAARSAAPSNGSMSSSSGTARAMALTVKSRRDRSASTASLYTTSGLRESGLYTSARWVVISNVRSSWRQPMVPKRSPWVHTASAHPFTSRLISAGRASVVRSMSASSPRVLPSSRSRTIPPTR